MRRGRPLCIVIPQRFAIGIAEKRGAVGNFGGAVFRGREILDFGKKGEPAPECGLIGVRVQAEKIRRTIEAGIGEIRRLVELCARDPVFGA